LSAGFSGELSARDRKSYERRCRAGGGKVPSPRADGGAGGGQRRRIRQAAFVSGRGEQGGYCDSGAAAGTGSGTGRASVVLPPRRRGRREESKPQPQGALRYTGEVSDFAGFFSALGVSAVELSAGARGADAGVPRRGVAATDRRFEAKIEIRGTAKICQSGSLKVSYWEEQAVTGVV